jgi:cysteine desulfurase
MSNIPTIYADYQATTPVDPRVVAAMEPFWRETFGNPHSTDHIMGWKADEAVNDAASSVAALIGSDPSEIVFTSGATESNNLALLGIGRRAPPERQRLLVSTIEHKSVLAAARSLGEREGLAVEIVPVDRHGFVHLDVLGEMLDEDVLLVSVMAVNNEIGTMQSISEIADLVHSYGALLHSDAAQAPCAMDTRTLASSADLLSISGHKIYGPKGIGALSIRHELVDLLEPLIYGGGQQNGIRSGTVAVPLCVGMGVAAEILSDEKAADERSRVASLRDRFVEELRSLTPSVVLNGPKGLARHPGNSSLRFPGVDGEVLIASMQPALAASTGSACTAGTPEPSHVLRSIGLTADEADSSVRFSFGRFTTELEVRRATDTVAMALNSLA